MGRSENPTNYPKKQETRQRGVPRVRRCLLKGCERRFRPRQAGQRYCGGPCRKAARTWPQWRAQGKYRATPAGKQQRNGQSRRYRERVRNRKTPAGEAVPDAARVIAPDFFRRLLRPARLLSRVRASAALAAAKVLHAPMPARVGARLGARVALATDTGRVRRPKELARPVKRDILIRPRHSPYIHLVPPVKG